MEQKNIHCNPDSQEIEKALLHSKKMLVQSQQKVKDTKIKYFSQNLSKYPFKINGKLPQQKQQIM